MLKNQFIKNNLILITGTLFGGFLGYLFNFIVSRQISIAQFGELQSLTSSFIIFGVFNSALSFFAIRHTSVFAAHNDFVANRSFTNYLKPRIKKITIILLLALLILGFFLSSLLHFSSYLGFFIISLTIYLSTLTVIYFETLRGWQNFLALSVIGSSVALVKFLAGSSLAYYSHKTSIISLSFLLSALAGWYLSKKWSEQIDSGEDHNSEDQTSWKNKYFAETNVRRSAGKIFFFSLSLILVSNIDVILVKYFTPADTAGYYGAFSILGKIVLWLTLPVVGVILPGACADGHGGKRPKKEDLLKSYALMTGIAFCIISVYFFLPNFIVNLFFGKKYIFDIQYLWLFGLMSYLLSILTLEANLAFAKRDFRAVYILATALFFMVAGLAKFHNNLAQIVISISASFLFGYIFIVILNLTHERRISTRKQ